MLYVSFNGGKDATAVLFLTLMAMQQYVSLKLAPPFNRSLLNAFILRSPILLRR
jgi:hypothetical protein